MKKRIIFVCTGNTCRSPMAEALFMDIIKEKGIQEAFEVSSAGVYAFDNDPASYQAIEVMKKEYDIDIKPHRAKVLDGSDIEKADLILTMTKRHKNMIVDIYPEASTKVYVLKEFVGAEGDADIIDPFGLDYEAYKTCANEIEQLLIEVLERI
ncbi:MAG: low molecular weight protein arginine phosphatase [Acetivibrionales bacterium]|jgi:protein-tyrosine-phosphatase|nr:low molecular weight protein arginine phosphatase [Clostridiaceae bacterium]